METAVGLVMKELWPYIEKEVKLHLNSKEEADNLISNLKKIQELLDNSQGKQLADPEMKRSLDVLEATASDMEDAIDEWKMAKNQRAPEITEGANGSLCFLEKICGFVHCLSCSPNQVYEYRRMAKVVRDLNEIVNRVYEKTRKELNYSPMSKEFKKDATVPTILEAEYPGRESDKETIKKMVKDIPRGGQEIPFSVVAIVGEGGLGKTTLAQLVYNDYELGVEGDFSIKIWIYVSNTFDEVRIAEEILERIQGRKPNVSAFSSVVEKIKDSLARKRFLLVLDDVWIEDQTKWKSMKGYLSSGAPGSVILMTTRKERAAVSMMGDTNSRIYRLEPLSDESCWSIIEQIALEGKGRRFEIVGMKIAKKCKGSPLAAHILGGHLRDKSDVSDWEHVLKSETWELTNVKDDLFRHFFMSYDELDPMAKRCFSYCAVFPKDTEMKVEQLIRIWMAQGFLSSSQENDDYEMVERRGKECFDNLAQRSFFQNFVKDSGGRIYRCKMHDIVHDFAQYLMENKCHIIENGKEGNPTKTCRHLYVGDKVKSTTVPISNLKLEKLRSVYCYGVVPLSLPDLKCVRGLTLSRRWVESMTEEIESLVHLRYLCLHSSSSPGCIGVPEAITNLYNLETLYLQGYGFSHLPHGISKLTNLKYIFMESNNLKFPNGFEKLTHLRGLNRFSKRPGTNNLGYLEKMNHLRGEIEISLQDLNGGVHVKDAEKATLRDKEFLSSLVLNYNKNVEISVVEALEPHPNLQRLECQGPALPRWIPNITNLIELEISLNSSSSPNIESLSSLAKLQFLQHLVLCWRRLEHLGRDFLGLNNYGVTTSQSMKDIISFPALKKLEFYCCNSWEEWEDIREEELSDATNVQIMPRLTELKISSCPRLKKLPHRLLQAASSLQHVQIDNCRNLGNQGLYKFGDNNKIPQFGATPLM